MKRDLEFARSEKEEAVLMRREAEASLRDNKKEMEAQELVRRQTMTGSERSNVDMNIWSTLYCDRCIRKDSSSLKWCKYTMCYKTLLIHELHGRMHPN